MKSRVEVFTKKEFPDILGIKIKLEIEDIGISSIDKIRVAQVYLIDGNISNEDIKLICNELLVDGVTQDYLYYNEAQELPSDMQAVVNEFEDKNAYSIEVTRKRGVMDPVESTVIKGIKDLGLGADSVKTASRFMITGGLSTEQIEIIADKVLANKIIEDVYINKQDLFYDSIKNIDYVFKKNIFEILNADDERLLSISENGQLYLNLEEMKTVTEIFCFAGKGTD